MHINQAAIAREASEFVAWEERATATSNNRTPRQPASVGQRTQNQHEHWWHSTVLAVAQMVSATGLGATPWRGKAAADRSSNDTGRSARLHLGSAEIAAKMSSGYGFDDHQVVGGNTPFRGGVAAMKVTQENLYPAPFVMFILCLVVEGCNTAVVPWELLP